MCECTQAQVKDAIHQLMREGSCVLDEDKLEQLEKLLPTKVRFAFLSRCVCACACVGMWAYTHACLRAYMCFMLRLYST